MAETTSFLPAMLIEWVRRFGNWIDSRQPQDLALRSPSARYWGDSRLALFSFCFLFAGLLLPADGMGLRMCLFHHATGMDCPGCGMTRAVSSLWRGNLQNSLHLHLFAPVVFTALFLHSASLVLPLRRKEVFLDWLDRWDGWLRWVWAGGAVSFFVYGALRMFWTFPGVGR